jgi:photosynthetic reaction center H subunit
MSAAFTPVIDVAQIVFCAFVAFFFGLVYYLRREDKREGYPLEEATATRLNHAIVGFPDMPAPKTYKLMEGGTTTLPQEYERGVLKAKPRFAFPGAALYPVGDPMLAGIGPGSYALRRDEPFVMFDGSPQLAPLREALDYTCVDEDMDPRGMRVFGSDYHTAGTVVDIWIDKGSKILRYIEIVLDGEGGRRLVPIFYTQIDGKARELRVHCVKAAQLAMAPILRDPVRITAREEDRVNAYYAGGYLYSMPLREALL